MALRVWWIRNPPNEGDLTDKTVTSNAGGLEVMEAGIWEDWYCLKCGEDIDGCECRAHSSNKKSEGK